MSHNHSHNISNIDRTFLIGILVNIIFIAFEVGFAFLSNSTALLADAGHNLSDVLALVFSWFAILLSRRKPTLRFTYGLRRTTILTAILNTILLIVTVGYIAWEAINRIYSNSLIHSKTIIIVASIGILVNGFTAFLFMKGKERDLNIKSTFQHFIADALVSFGVVVAGVIILFSGFNWIDSVISLLISAIILYSSYRLLIDSVNLALDAVPKDIDINSVSKFLSNLEKVQSIHDLHIWALSTSETALTVHLVTKSAIDEKFLDGINDYLESTYGIRHTTIQIESIDSRTCSSCN